MKAHIFDTLLTIGEKLIKTHVISIFTCAVSLLDYLAHR